MKRDKKLNKLKERLRNKKAVVGIVGLGYVGLPTAVTVAQNGFKTFGVDIDQKRVNQLSRGQSYIADIPSNLIRDIKKKFTPTADWRVLKKCHVIIISVPTPLSEYKTPDLSAIESAAGKVSEYLNQGALVILESTTYPGTTEEVVKPILENFGLNADKNFYLAYAPERVDPGNRRISRRFLSRNSQRSGARFFHPRRGNDQVAGKYFSPGQHFPRQRIKDVLRPGGY
jgi:UDP-N-acetyl-D-glucosamine dehydrogenase